MARSTLTGTRIRERRMAQKLRQADLARAVGISAAYLNLIEHNRRRVSDPLLAVLAAQLGVPAEALSEGAESALFEALREAAAGAEGTEPGRHAPAELERIEEFVGRFPGWAGVLATRQARLAALERVVETYSERMGQDPFLLDELHEVLSAVTSLRSSAAILAETADIEPEWQARFLATIASESLRLTAAAEGLVAYLDGIDAAETGLAAPLDQLEAWLETRGWHFAEFESANPPPPEAMIAQAPELAASAARDLARAYLLQARDDARAVPLSPLGAAVAAQGPDPARLAAHFGVPMDVMFRRLATLPTALPGGGLVPPMGLVVCDASGAFTLRRPLPGFALPRSSAACPLWPLYEALTRPMQPLRVALDMAGRLPQRFTAYALAVPRNGAASFDAPAPMQAMMLVTPATALVPGEPLRPVGISCRVCPRGGCAGRREPSLVAPR